MKLELARHVQNAMVGFAVFTLTELGALGADFLGSIQEASKPITGSTVTLYAAGSGAPAQLAQGKTDANGAFKLTYADASAGSVLYVVAKGGTATAAMASGPNPAIGLSAVLDGSVPKQVVVNEFTTVASVWTCAQFLEGEVLSGPKLGLALSNRAVRLHQQVEPFPDRLWPGNKNETKQIK